MFKYGCPTQMCWSCAMTTKTELWPPPIYDGRYIIYYNIMFTVCTLSVATAIGAVRGCTRYVIVYYALSYNARAQASTTVVTTTPPVTLVERSLFRRKWISRRHNATKYPHGLSCIYGQMSLRRISTSPPPSPHMYLHVLRCITRMCGSSGGRNRARALRTNR